MVPFAEKDRAKALGARWDAARKVWYVQGVENLDAFAEWMPGQRTQSITGAETSSPAARPIRAVQPHQRVAATSAGVITGARVIPLSCDCLPWVGCEKCRTALETTGWGAKT